MICLIPFCLPSSMLHVFFIAASSSLILLLVHCFSSLNKRESECRLFLVSLSCYDPSSSWWSTEWRYSCSIALKDEPHEPHGQIWKYSVLILRWVKNYKPTTWKCRYYSAASWEWHRIWWDLKLKHNTMQLLFHCKSSPSNCGFASTSLLPLSWLNATVSSATGRAVMLHWRHNTLNANPCIIDGLRVCSSSFSLVCWSVMSNPTETLTIQKTDITANT